MSSVVVNGDTSGAVTLSAPAVAGTVTVTLPAASGTMLTTASTAVVTQAMLSTNVAGNGPAFSVYLGSSQTITSATYTKVQLNTERFDTNNNFASSRFTPTIAGYYQVSGQTSFGGYSSTGLSFPAIYKNGSRFKDGGACPFDASDGQYANVSCLIYLNGSTDYIELYVFQRSLSTRDLNVGDAARVYFTAAMIRSA